MEYSISTQKVINFVKSASTKKIAKQDKNKLSQVIPLDEATKNNFELAHSTELKNPMIYLDSDDDEYFSHSHLLAYAIANQIHIKKSKYNLGSEETQEILEHELTHVQQYSENRINSPEDELEFEAVQNETKHMRNGEEVHWVELVPGKYYQMTATEYKRMLNKIAEDFEEEVEQELFFMNEEEQLSFLINLEEWSNSCTSERFRFRG